ncbi:MAG: hypothetical protein ABSF29_05540 [Tepidisphaeraceae bacterium]|jgi:hypothetical protein
MTLERLQRILKGGPFRPFDLYTEDGEVLCVRAPGTVWLCPSKKVVMVATSKLLQIEEIQELQYIARLSRLYGGNGNPKRGKSAA